MIFVISIWRNTQDIILTAISFVAYVLAVYFAIVPHEIAHGLAAKWNGDLTAKVNGRLSMNPVVHFDLIGFAMLLTVGFGFAKPVPVNPYNFKIPRRGLFTTAIAGVAYNLAAVIFGSLLLAVTLFIGNSVEISSLSAYYVYNFFYLFLLLFVSVNTCLFLFNIIPLGPLDGFKIIEAYAHRNNRFIGFLRNYGTYILIGLVGLHLFVNYMVDIFPILYYFDILGRYIDFFSHWIGGGILSLFTMLFGLGPIGLGIL